ncbi:MAG: ABC transporter substrate-binding protein [Acidobacteria bacterium]|nr:ABC transporter substrate-binding protein [Acidobacteriota bacterium]
MRRRGFILLIGSAAVAWPVIGLRSQWGKIFHLGILTNTRSFEVEEFLKGLRDHGYVEGQNLIVEYRFSEGYGERWPKLASELVAFRVDAIFVLTTPTALAAKHATNEIPIIISTALEPVGAGLAANLAHPGGNVTGMSLMAPELGGKHLSLFKEAIPSLHRVAVLWNAANPAFTNVRQDVNEVARSIGLTLVSQPVREPEDFTAAFAALAENRPDGLLILLDALVGQHIAQIAEFAAREHLPIVSAFSPRTRLGGLMSYGTNIAAACRKAAESGDRVFRGENPRDLPFQNPTTFELVINLKTAKALGITLPQSILERADEVIE